MSNKTITRRSFLKLIGRSALAGSLAMLGGWQYVTQLEPGWVDISEVRLPLKRLPRSFDGLRLVQLSDIHMGGWMNRERLDNVVQLTLSLKPDVVALTGDYLTGRGWRREQALFLDELAGGLRPLAEACPVVAVLGNHDHWTRASAVRAMLAQVGAVDLSNTVHTLKNGSEQLHLAGVDSYYERFDRLDRVLNALPDEGAAILLAHEPDYADFSAATGRFDLQISGHSHGGQVVIPFYGPPVLPDYGRKYPSGLYQVEGMFQYTNRGVGMARIPVRFNCRPEITLFNLQAG